MSRNSSLTTAETSLIRAISLDLDDTLWPVWPTIHKAEARLLAWLQAHAPATARHWVDRQAILAIRRELETLHADRVHDLSFLRQETIRVTLERAGDDVALSEPAFAVFFAARQEVEPYPEVEEALAQLAQRHRLIALSNGNAQVLDMAMGRHFCAAISARDAGVAKPAARIFAMAVEAAGCAPHEVLHVGDDAELDVEGARRAGLQAIWLNRDDKPWPLLTEPPPQIRTLRQLLSGA